MPRVVNLNTASAAELAAAIRIDRRTRWGNKHYVGRCDCKVGWHSRADAIKAYEADLTEDDKIEIRSVFAGEDVIVACHCAPLPCHGDVILRIANENPDGTRAGRCPDCGAAQRCIDGDECPERMEMTTTTATPCPKPPVEKVISGGQTGADQGGLAAAAVLGLATGGEMPKGFRTDDGNQPFMKERFGMTESEFSTYQPRTKVNVENADATVIFGNLNSPGSLLTKRLCKEKAERLGKPLDDILMCNPASPWVLRKWLAANNVRVLNIAGNRESKNPGITERVMNFMIKALE